MIAIFRNQNGELRNGWWILLFYLVLAALLIPTIIFTSRQGTEPGIPLQAALVVVATYLCLLGRREHPGNVLGTLASWRRHLPIGLLSGTLIWGVTALALWLSGAVTWHTSDWGKAALATGSLDCLAVAVVEELLFRGFPFQRLVAGIGAWPAQLAMAGYFTLVHSSGLAATGDLQWLATANIFLAGLLFGACYLRTKSLALPIAMHFSLNLVQGPLLGFGVSGHGTSGVLVPDFGHSTNLWTGGAFGLEASLPGTLAIFIALIATLLLRPRGTPSDCTAAMMMVQSKGSPFRSSPR